MAKASYLQTSFLSGEWSPLFQGRADDQTYREGLNVCLNGFPIEEGAWNRRSGSKQLGITHNAMPGRTLSFAFTASQPYDLILTDGYLRFMTDKDGYLLDALPPQIASITTANPALVTTRTAHGWSDGDSVMFLALSTSDDMGAMPLVNREFQIIVASSTSFYIYDPLGSNPFDGSTVAWAGNPASVARITEFTTPYTADQLEDVVLVQSQNTALLLHPLYIPYTLTATPPSVTSDASFTFEPVVLEDGPYMDFVPNGLQVQLTNSTGKLEFTASYAAWADDPTTYSKNDVATAGGVIYVSLQDNNRGHAPATNPTWWAVANGYPGLNGGAGLGSTDVGRLVRFFQEPALWAVGTTYSAGDAVKYNGAYYKSLVVGNTGNKPDISPVQWEATQETAYVAWTWGEIVAVVSPLVFDVQLKGDALINALPWSTWALGLYSAATSYPSSGAFHQDRFWLAGAQPNRIDGTTTNGASNGELIFSPTLPDGTITDDSACFFELEADDANSIYWVIPDHQGLVMGTKGGEWSIQASNLSDPITPTSIQAHRNTKYGCENIQPRRAGISLAFVQRGGLKVLEYVADVYSGKYSGFNISRKAKHMLSDGVKEIAYQEEKFPCIWVLTKTGALAGCTYRRDSPFATQPASFSGWHRHTLGTGRSILSISCGYASEGNSDTVTLVTQDPATGYCYVERLAQMFDVNDTLPEGWFVDGGVTPAGMKYIPGSPDIIRLYGLGAVAGQTLDVVGGGIDLGSFTVSATGTIDVPVGAGSSLLTKAYIETVTSANLGTGRIVWGPGPPAPATTALLAYTPSNGDTGDDAGSFAIDYKNRRAWGCYQYDGRDIGSCRVHVYDLDTQQMLGVWDSGGYPNTVFNYNSNGPGCIDEASGDFVIPGTHPGFIPYPVLARFHYDAVTGTVTRTRANKMGGAQTSLGSRLRVGTSTYLMTLGIGSLQAQMPVYVFNISTGSIVGTFAMTEKNGLVANGAKFDKYGTAFTGGLPQTPATAGYILALYKATLTSSNVFTNTRLGQITATQIDATWSNSDTIGVQGLLYDETDGNLIAAFTNTTKGTKYLAKFNVQGTTLAVQWTYLSTWTGLGDADYDWPQCNCQNGKLIFIQGTTLYILNTITGTVVSSATAGVNLTSQRFDDNTGEIYVHGASPFDPWSTTGLNAGQTNVNFSTFGPPYYVPFCIGKSFTSQGQLLRPLAPQESGAQNGPALGKTRRTHMLAVLFHSAQGVQWGTDFASSLRTCDFRTDGGTPYTKLQLYSGVFWDTLEDDYSFNSQPAWQITRPYPCTVCAVEAFLRTEDR